MLNLIRLEKALRHVNLQITLQYLNRQAPAQPKDEPDGKPIVLKSAEKPDTAGGEIAGGNIGAR